MVPWLFLAASLIGAAFTTSAMVRARRLRLLVVPYFFGSWLTGELALHHIAWQALATLIFIALGALAAWPGTLGLAITLASWLALGVIQIRARGTEATFRQALGELAPAQDLRASPRELLNPFRLSDPRVERIRDLPYGERLERDRGRRNLLDVYRPREAGSGRPVLLQIHGGGWTIGHKEQQALPLMNFLAGRGWVCVAPNYRLCPEASFPDPIIDVKRALAWIRANAHEYGADPGFVCVTGGSAGGHLAALLALSANDPALQPGFESVDTSVAAAVPLYGIYDLLERHGAGAQGSMRGFLERFVLKCSPESHHERWESFSPLSRIHADAPPFLVIHGSHDSLAMVEDARIFVEALRAKSRNPVLYAELPQTQHGFDLFHSERSAIAVRAITSFLENRHARYRGEASRR